MDIKGADWHSPSSRRSYTGSAAHKSQFRHAVHSLLSVSCSFSPFGFVFASVQSAAARCHNLGHADTQQNADRHTHADHIVQCIHQFSHICSLFLSSAFAVCYGLMIQRPPQTFCRQSFAPWAKSSGVLPKKYPVGSYELWECSRNQ